MSDATDGAAIARERIAREATERTGSLDLGELGLTILPEELFALKHLRQLNLGSRFIDEEGERQESSAAIATNDIESSLSRLIELPELEVLYLSACRLASLDGVAGLRALRQINCSNNQVSDLQPLAKLPLLRGLDCSHNPVSDLRPLFALTVLEWLDCNDTQVSDLRPVTGLTALQLLHCSDTEVRDLSPLANLTALQELRCSKTQVRDLQPLADLALLEWLDCSLTGVSDLAPLAGLTVLHMLDCGCTLASKLEPLANLTALEWLDCRHTLVSDLRPLARLPSLRRLECYNTQVCDLRPLANLTALEWLDCSHTKVRDLGPLAGLAALERLSFFGTEVSNLQPLVGLAALQWLDCSACSLIGFPQKVLFRPSLEQLILCESQVPGVPAAVLSQTDYDNCLERLRAHVRRLPAGTAPLADVNLMARAFRNSGSPEQGELVVEKLSPDCVQVFYVPPQEKVKQSGLDPDKIAEYRVKLLHINGQDQGLTIFPTNTLGGHHKFLKPKHQKVERITLAKYFSIEDPVPATRDEIMEMLETLPSGFTKDYDFGLGLAKDYRFIVEAVEELSDCTEIVISSKETGIDGERNIFFMSAADFERARRALNSIGNIGRSAARSVKDATAYNILAEKIGRPAKHVKAGRHPLRKLITAVAQGDEPLAENEQEAVLDVLSHHTKAIAEAKPEKLAKLQSDIELVTLQILIERYEEMIGKKLKEERWQTFFHENPFVLNLAFGYPVIKVQDQASVGGRKLSGSGEKITDFLVKNSLTNNTAIFEIKTPQANLLNKTEFRDGVYTPSAELSGSINHALDQKYQFQGQIAHIKNNSRIYDIESYSVHCCLIIGTMPSGYDQLKSFELFRRNFKNVEIVTFDELLEKLKQLLDFLATEETELVELQLVDTQD